MRSRRPRGAPGASVNSARNERLALQRSNVLRYVVGHPGRTSSEIAAALGMSPQIAGQVLHKGEEFWRDERGWRAR